MRNVIGGLLIAAYSASSVPVQAGPVLFQDFSETNPVSCATVFADKGYKAELASFSSERIGSYFKAVAIAQMGKPAAEKSIKQMAEQISPRDISTKMMQAIKCENLFLKSGHPLIPRDPV